MKNAFKFEKLKDHTQDGIEKGYNQAVSSLFKEYFRDKILEQPDTYLEIIHETDRDDFLKWATSRKKVKRYRYVFIVVNLKPTITLEMAKPVIAKCLKKKWIKWYMYSYEQRSDTFKDMGKGIHLNFLFELTKNKSPWQCKSEVYNTFKNLVGNAKHVCHRMANDKTNFVNYIKGIKKGEKKREQAKVDKRWREKQNLSQYYEPPTIQSEEIYSPDNP